MSKINNTPFPELRTEHFVLRQLREKDAESVYSLRSDERVMKYLDRPRAESIADAREFIEKIIAGIQRNECIYWAVCEKPTGTFLGTICLWNFSDSGSIAEIGFELLPKHHGKGIMQEVAPRVLDFGFHSLGLKRIEGEVAPENIKSIRLMEKFGFVYEKTLGETVVYVLNRLEQ